MYLVPLSVKQWYDTNTKQVPQNISPIVSVDLTVNNTSQSSAFIPFMSTGDGAIAVASINLVISLLHSHCLNMECTLCLLS